MAQPQRVTCWPLRIKYKNNGNDMMVKPTVDTFRKLKILPLYQYLRSSYRPEKDGLTLTMPNIEQLTKEDVIYLLEHFVSKHKYLSFNAINKITIKDVKMCDLFIYKLTTITETRTSKWRFEPIKYKNRELIDKPSEFNSFADPWDVRINYKKDEKKTKHPVVVPHTDRVAICHTCHGHGTVSDIDNKSTTCNSCKGHKYLKIFLTVQAYWTKKSVSVLIDPTKSNRIDLTRVKNLKKSILFQSHEHLQQTSQNFDENNKFLEPLVTCINQKIKSFESSMDPYSVLKEQEQTIEHLPLAVIEYEYKNRRNKFFIVGSERKVIFDNYPTTQCIIL